MDARRPYGRFNTCEDKAAFINEEGYKFVAVERYYLVPLPISFAPLLTQLTLFVYRYFDANLCPQFRYLTILRHPIKRIISNMVFQAYRPSDIMQWARHDSKAVRFYGGTPIVDNYYIRVLNGPDLYFAPLGSIRREHLERAKEILSKFEIVMTLEDWARTSRQLVAKLGMKEKDVNRIENTRKNAAGEYRFNGREVEKPLDDEQVLELTIMNALDIELFEFASQLSLALTHNIPFHP